MSGKLIPPNGEKPTHGNCKARLTAVGDAIYAIGGKWKLRIIVALSDGPKRFNELQRLVEGVSARVLSAELKDMELNGFVSRKIDTGIPVIVEYQLTDYSDTLQDVLQALGNWGANHRERIKNDIRNSMQVAN